MDPIRYPPQRLLPSYMALPQNPAFALFGGVLSATLLAVSLADVMNLIFTIALNFLISGAAVRYMCCKVAPGSAPPGGQHEVAAEQTPATAVPELSDALVAPASSTRRTYFLDNLKSVLTAIVVNHHVMCATGNARGWYMLITTYPNSFGPFAALIEGLSQSYFMCLFFFMSGMFVPNSFDKHFRTELGAQGFRRDKIKRLGLPFLVYFYLLSAALNACIQLFVGKDVMYQPDNGPPWFLAWLIIFMFWYVY